jgi:hypothetical protein
MSNQRRIEQEWQEFEKKIMPKNAPEIQRKEMRRAFYAGAWTMLKLVQSLGADGIPEEDAIGVLEEVDKECIEFLSQVGKKY